jgi:signal transduction histidine kinase
MYQKTRLQLTFFYSIIFLILFWGLSFGIYFWMNQYFGDNGNSSICFLKSLFVTSSFSDASETASDIIMDRLGSILLMIDTALVFFIPFITWLIAGKTLAPIKEAHERERDFFTNISHDLRTPLTILQGEIMLALQEEQSIEAYKLVLQSSEEEVQSLISLTESILFFSIQNTTFELVDLTEVIF